MSELLAEAESLLPDTVALRRKIHAAPELGLDTPETQRAVLDALAELPLEIHTGGATSAIVATLRGSEAGRTLLLRADMDALPLHENTGLPFASERPGKMHACGHDAHTSMLVGAARILCEKRALLHGTVKFLFQPGEEGFGGARIAVEEGLLEAEPKVDAAFAIHINPVVPSGMVATRPGPFLASKDDFRVTLRGRGGHASMPHDAVDPIPVACEVVTALQAFTTRRFNVFDPVVITVAHIEGGTTFNVIPATATLAGTLRSISSAARERLREGIPRVAKGIAQAHGLEAEVEVIPGYPVTVNDDRFAPYSADVARKLLGDSAVVLMPSPVMGAEDFSYILERVPGAMVFLGARPAKPASGDVAPIHSDRMVLDESAMARGVALHAAMALDYLGA